MKYRLLNHCVALIQSSCKGSMPDARRYLGDLYRHLLEEVRGDLNNLLLSS